MKKGKTTIIDDYRSTNVLGVIWALFTFPAFFLTGVASLWSLFSDGITWNAVLGAVIGPGEIIGTIIAWVHSSRESERTVLKDKSIATYDRFGNLKKYVDLDEPVYYQDVSTIRYPFTLVSNKPIYVDSFWDSKNAPDAICIDRSIRDLKKKYDIEKWTNSG